MDSDQQPRDLPPDTGQPSGTGERPEMSPRLDPSHDRAGQRPAGVDDEHPADAEHYDPDHFEPL